MIETKFKLLNPCFRGQVTGSTWLITHSSACIYASNNISTAMPMFTEFSYASVILHIITSGEWLPSLIDDMPVGISLLSCVNWDIRYSNIYFRLQAAIIDFSLTLTSSWTKIRPTMLFDAMRIPLKFRIYSICNVRFNCFRFPPFWFPVELGSNCAQCDVAISSVTSVSSKTNAATLNLLPKAIYALWFNGHQVYHIFTKNTSSIPPSLINNDNINSWNLPFELKTCYK